MVKMNTKRLLWIGLAILSSIGIIVAITAALTPQQTNPAFAAATAFMEAAGKGDDDTAYRLLDENLQAYVTTTCPNGSVSECIASYIPPEWGKFLNVVFRRAVPDGSAWNVDLIASYEEDLGFSGVCIFQRMEQNSDGAWQVAEWAGFISCGNPDSRNMATNPNTPNRAP
jgi:hypothetical protein